MTNEKIIKAFTNKTHESTNRRKPLSIRDGKLFSYNLLIGEYVDRSEEGFIGLLIHNHMATGLGFVSATTSQHVSLLKRVTRNHPRIVRSNEGDLFDQ